ncbi:RNA polymerase sigma-70 factor (ECF subfamily) [Umezawaea tangerina]|uniref:RNA polymerase sigma-70 factor (ECF subfamily) n=1 Tax=Umezawaea tangerina TaxID=84725 RepID=A0A2T0TA10_9PSEU|nr:RNA polymerase sigma-70 factor (ECF subfamily) [Umezawaea tangerina]
MSSSIDVTAERHRRIVDGESTLDSSSLGEAGAASLAKRAHGSKLDELVARAATVKIVPAAEPSVAVLSARPDDLAAEVALAISGDRPAVERLLGSIRPLVVRYCRARIGRQERSFASADDVAQEVCLGVLTALPSYRDQGRPFLAFVYGIAAHKVADSHRASARNRSEPVPDVPDGPEQEAGPEQRAMRGELSREMASLLKVLPDKQREILLLRIVVGLSAEETADAVGSTPGAVRVAQHRALTRLRKVLSPEDVLDRE